MAADRRIFCESPGPGILTRDYWQTIFVVTLLSVSQAAFPQEAKTVIGPRNINLSDGAQALMAGDGEEGVRLTLLGLEAAHGTREAKAGHANLCAGYLLIDKPLEALEHCDWVLERDSTHWKTYNNRALVNMRLGRLEESEEDIRKGQALNPGSTTLKIVKGMYRDKTEPVTPHIEIDDRRDATGDLLKEQASDSSN